MLLAVNWLLCPHLIVPAISAMEAPILDGDLSDAAWRDAVPMTVLTWYGGDFGDRGESRITVRAVRDSQNIYLGTPPARWNICPCSKAPAYGAACASTTTPPANLIFPAIRPAASARPPA